MSNNFEWITRAEFFFITTATPLHHHHHHHHYFHKIETKVGNVKLGVK